MFTGQLYDFQKDSAQKLINRRRAILAAEQGLGKTIIAIASCEKLFTLHKIRHVLVLAQSANAWQWKDKIEEFSDTNVILAAAKDKSSRTYRPETKGPSYTVVPWTLFRNDYATIAGFPWDCVIADEAQEFKNFKTKTAKLVKRLNVAIKPRYRWALTGTVISNNLQELYSIMYWVEPKFLPPWPAFEKMHIVRQNGIISSYKNLIQLNGHLEKKLDRKTHKDAKGQMPRLMPPVIYKIPASKEYLQAQVKLLATLDNLVAHLKFDKEGNIVSAHDPKVAKAFHEAKSLLASPDKLKFAYDLSRRILAENPDNRVVFFSHLKSPLYDLYEHFGRECVLFTGDQSSDEKQRNVHTFLSEGGPRILLCSNAGASGLDLYSANYVINLDVPPSHGILDQRIKRVTRLSSVHSTAHQIFLVLEGSIEEFYLEVVFGKGALASGVLEGTADEVVVRPESLRSFLSPEDKNLRSLKAPAKVTRSRARKAKPTNKGRSTSKPRAAPRRNRGV